MAFFMSPTQGDCKEFLFLKCGDFDISLHDILILIQMDEKNKLPLHHGRQMKRQKKNYYV